MGRGEVGRGGEGYGRGGKRWEEVGRGVKRWGGIWEGWEEVEYLLMHHSSYV